ncbi:hypothetical protein B296_00010918, partial [Ensete ventricosum]
CGLVAGDSPLRAGRSRPLQGAWPQPVAPLQGALAAIGRPCKGAGHGHARLPLTRASFAAKT